MNENDSFLKPFSISPLFIVPIRDGRITNDKPFSVI
jgi:hypothetical protein